MLLKQLPSPPAVLKSGELSKNKAQLTTYDMYSAAITEHGLSRVDYGEMLAMLQERGYRDFFVRDAVSHTEEELLSYERHVYAQYQDMLRALEDEEMAYHNPSQQTCPSCSLINLCHAMERQDDVQDIVANQFMVREPRVTIPKEMMASGGK